ncbi:hypothetical protein PRZ48_002694 [Zasmidium cellare]|uniref:SDH C-terminal domain-containing protein n=1 Tax=Zasmidium cellare TaxID=395010 RepID=A0ABR0ET61_ZASCE|nr:hypothetical protein PRZ48_002694 [Zasmidium cellare]
MVLEGSANSTLLDSYETERRPIAELYSRQSAANGRKIFSFLKHLGTADIADVDTARANLYRTIQDPSKQAMIVEGVEGQREHFDNLELHIGYVYDNKYAPRHASHYEAKFVPGARLPHSWIEPLVSTLPPIDLSYIHGLEVAYQKARHYSNLDLCEPEAFTIIALDKTTANHAYQAAQGLNTYGLRLKVHRPYVDFKYTAIGNTSSREQGEHMSLLIRPDQHILVCTESFDGPEHIMDSILRGVDILAEQAYAQSELWTGEQAPVDVMLSAIKGKVATKI